MNTQPLVSETESLADGHTVVSREEWLIARERLLEKEKDLTRLRDRLSEERRALPWVRVEKRYLFDGPDGRETLGQLFAGRSQLVIYHFMLGPGWKEGCVGCSFLSDHIEGALVHLENHDVSLIVVSRAPWTEIEAFRKRMGWSFKWVSSYGSDFNFDYHVSFTPEQVAKGEVYYNYAVRNIPMDELSGHSVFYRDENGGVYHTYSTYARGSEHFINAYNYLDLTPKGRNETGPNFSLTDWVRHHDRYGARGYVDNTGRFVSQEDETACRCGVEEASRCMPADVPRRFRADRADGPQPP